MLDILVGFYFLIIPITFTTLAVLEVRRYPLTLETLWDFAWASLFWPLTLSFVFSSYYEDNKHRVIIPGPKKKDEDEDSA